MESHHLRSTGTCISVGFFFFFHPVYPQVFMICHNYAWPDPPYIVSKPELNTTWIIHLVCCFCCHTFSCARRPEFQRDDRAEVYIIIMLSGHKAGSEGGRDRDRKKRTTDSCAELCSTTESGCGLSAGLRCVCCLWKRRGGQRESVLLQLLYVATLCCCTSELSCSRHDLIWAWILSTLLMLLDYDYDYSGKGNSSKMLN